MKSKIQLFILLFPYPAILLLSSNICAQVISNQVEGASNAILIGRNCLGINSFGMKAWDLLQVVNGSLAVGVSWKAEIRNNCSSSWTAELDYFLLPDIGYSVGEFGGTVKIPPSVKNYSLTGRGWVNLEKFLNISSAVVTIDPGAIDLVAPPQPCISASTIEPMFLDVIEPFGSISEPSFYGSTTVSAKINLVNRCSTDLSATINFVTYDKDAYYLSENSTQAVIRAFSTTEHRFAYTDRRTRQRFANQYSATSVRETPLNILTSFYFYSESRWLNSAVVELDEASNRMSIAGVIDNDGYFSYDLVLNTSTAEPLFVIDESSFRALTTRPRLSSDYDSFTNELTIPAVRSPQGAILENVRLQLIDPENLTFILKSFDIPSPPMTINTSRLQCIEVESANSSEVIDENQIAHYTASIKIANRCTVEHRGLQLRYRLLSHDDFILHTEPFRIITLGSLKTVDSTVQFSVDLKEMVEPPVREEFLIASPIAAPIFN